MAQMAEWLLPTPEFQSSNLVISHFHLFTVHFCKAINKLKWARNSSIKNTLFPYRTNFVGRSAAHDAVES